MDAPSFVMGGVGPSTTKKERKVTMSTTRRIAEIVLDDGRTARVEKTGSGYEVTEHRERTGLENMAQALTLGFAALGQEPLDKKVAKYSDVDDALNHARSMK